MIFKPIMVPKVALVFLLLVLINGVNGIGEIKIKVSQLNNVIKGLEGDALVYVFKSAFEIPDVEIQNPTIETVSDTVLYIIFDYNFVPARDETDLNSKFQDELEKVLEKTEISVYHLNNAISNMNKRTLVNAFKRAFRIPDDETMPDPKVEDVDDNELKITFVYHLVDSSTMARYSTDYLKKTFQDELNENFLGVINVDVDVSEEEAEIKYQSEEMKSNLENILSGGLDQCCDEALEKFSFIITEDDNGKGSVTIVYDISIDLPENAIHCIYEKVKDLF